MINNIYNKNVRRPKNLVQTIERVALILDVLGNSLHDLSIKELSEKLSLPKGTIHRLVTSLVYFGFVNQNELTKNYHLGFKLTELAHLLLNQIDFRDEARPLMIELSERIGETIHLVMLNRNEAVYIDKVALNQSGLQMLSRIGLSVPIHCSAVGKVLAAHLPEDKLEKILIKKKLERRTDNTITNYLAFKEHLSKVKLLGWAIDDEENEYGIRCVAAPIRNENGDVVAAMSISGPSIRIKLKHLKRELKDNVCDTSLKISQKIGYKN